MSVSRLQLNELGQGSSDGETMTIEVTLESPPDSPIFLGSYDGAVGTVTDPFARDQGLSEAGFDVRFVFESEERVVVWAIAFGDELLKPVYTLECNSILQRGEPVRCFPHGLTKGTTPRHLRVG